METEFLRYQEEDYADLLEMIGALYQEDPEGEPIDEGKIKRTVREAEEHPEKVRIYLMKRKEEKIGYAILVYYWSNEYGGNILTIDELFVRKEYRGLGAGTEFCTFAEGLENKTAIQLETTPSNKRVYNYYRRLGFTPSQNTHLIKQVY